MLDRFERIGLVGDLCLGPGDDLGEKNEKKKKSTSDFEQGFLRVKEPYAEVVHARDFNINALLESMAVGCGCHFHFSAAKATASLT